MRRSIRTRPQEQLRDILAGYPGIQSEVVTFLGDRISESLSGETAQVAVKVFGDDLDALDATGDKIVAVLGKVPGIVDLQFKRQSGTPTIAHRARCRRRWRPPVSRCRTCSTRSNTAYAGAMVGQTFHGTRTVDVVVLLPDELRHQPAQLAQLMIASPAGPGTAVAGRAHHRAPRIDTASSTTAASGASA